METAYQVLGISPGASEQEIKKAYFSLVRTNSPETNPEQFQKIRAAYEQLKNGGWERKGPEFPPMEDPWAAKLYRHITELAARGDWEWCKEACEEGYRKFPKYSQFLYSLVHAQIMCGNTGKAVKSAERLAATEPDNPWFQKELAGACLSRGYMKKALSAFERTVELGCADTDCMLGYSRACGECGQYDRGIRILFDIVNQDKKWPKERLKEPVDAYYGLLEFNHNGPQTYFGEILEHLGSFLKQYRVSLSEYVLDLAEHLAEYFVEDRDGENVRKAEQAFELLKSCCRDRDLKEDIDQEARWLMEQRLSRDERFGEALKSACEVYALLENEGASQIRRFAYADVQLCMLEEHLEVLDQAKILQEEYPAYYAMLEDFLKKLRSEGDLGRLKEQLLKDYRRMEPNFSGGKYFEKYPEERNRGQGRLVSAGGSEEPYVRSEKKVGRNDPCPCGSGKKYKYCCMNK